MESRISAVTIASKAGQTLGVVDAAPGRMRANAIVEYARTIAKKFSAPLEALLSPLALTAYVFAAWRVAADIGWASTFVIHTGLFSHWLVWLTIGLSLSFCASILNADEPADKREDPA